jgi:hypothetical protein
LVRTKTSVRPALALERGHEGVDLVVVVDAQEAVLDRALVLHGVLVLVAAGIAGVGLGQAARLAVEGRGEHDGLAVGGDLPDDAVDGGAEAHVQHAVGLVEDEGADVAEGQRAAVQEVLQAARGGHEDVGLRRELGLLHEPGAAVDGGDAQRAGVGQRAQLLHDLQGELAGRGEHERGGAAGLGGGAIDERHAEGEGLARAGRRLEHHVVAREQVLEHELLDGERRVDVALGERVDDGIRDAELGERGGRHWLEAPSRGHAWPRLRGRKLRDLAPPGA